MSIEALIEAIHASPVRLSLCICGAGAGAISRLTQVPECSRTLLQGEVLYHREATRLALDGLPRHIVSVEAARRLAQHVFCTSRRILLEEALEQQQSNTSVDGSGAYLFGVGATSAIKTSRVRRSSDQVFVSVWGGRVQYPPLPPQASPSSHHSLATPAPPLPRFAEQGEVFDYHVDMPDSLDRAGQDTQVSLLILHAVAQTVARCLPADTALVNSSSGNSNSTYPPSLFRTLLPPATAAEDATSLSQLCAVPSVDGPLAVPLDRTQEVTEAVQAVLSHPSRPDSPEDICVLWNRHGELRRSSRPPYDDEYDRADSGTAQTQQHVPPSVAVNTATPALLRLLYPGSFHPLHYGHTELVRAAIRVLRQRHRQDQEMDSSSSSSSSSLIPVQVTYEIAVKVVDKGAVECDDLQERVQQFLEIGERVAVTNAKLFISKAKLFPGHGFLIGIDTAVRVVDPQHYSSSTDPKEAEAAMVAALLRDIGERGCYFVVGGRKVDTASGWKDLTSLPIPEPIRHLFVGIPAVEFSVDISSTELRAQKRARLQELAATPL